VFSVLVSWSVSIASLNRLLCQNVTETKLITNEIYKI